ncbi:MAG: hypothetical protein ACREV5_04985 [Steroidobacter sp.]
MNSSEKHTDYLIVGDGGLPAEVNDVEDPFAALDDLMALIEILCPTWPAREPFAEASRFLL